MKIGSHTKVDVADIQFTENEYLSLVQGAIASGLPLEDYVVQGIKIALYRAKYDYEVLTQKRKEAKLEEFHRQVCINAEKNTAGIGRKRLKFGEKKKSIQRSDWGRSIKLSC
ncbi:MAG: hypothetical protein PHR77_14665 [Kiritimatiellae bacterium]|nr:hypothetical protein [Kiritimatiellia bacterium]MDD5521262.1 hypothetical protein [Kiritimatiellia bacterium]